jgi:hypothetical protein
MELLFDQNVHFQFIVDGVIWGRHQHREFVSMLSRLSIVTAIAATFAIAAPAFAETHVKKNVSVNRSVNVQRNVTVNRTVNVHRDVVVNRNVNVVRAANVRGLVVGRPYHGGVWYGTGRRFWNGAWYDYGIGPCWLLTPFNYYVWTCG